MDITPFSDFESAARGVLRFLHARLGFKLWMVTRTEGDDWIVLQAEDHGYGVTPGRVYRWADSFCSQMVQGLGPCIAPRSSSVPAYASAAIGRQVPIGAYIGVPLKDGDGQLFGTLCAIDPEPQSESLENELALLELLGRMLTSQLALHLKLSADSRLQQLHQLRQFVDPETNALTEVAWNRVLVAEEIRCQRFGHPAYFIGIQPPMGAEPSLVHELVRRVRNHLDGSQTIARLESNQLWILLPECNANAGKTKLQEIRHVLSPLVPDDRVVGFSRTAQLRLDQALSQGQRQLGQAKVSRLNVL